MVTRVIINADDFGYAHSVNYGIVDAHVQGVLTSTTLMANMPGFSHAVALKQDVPTLGVGVHLVVTCGKPLLAGHQHIVDENGDFHSQRYYTPERAADIFNEDFIAELRAEWTAQIDKVYAAGITPTHLDGHHHMFITFPATQRLSFELAEKYQLPIRVDGYRLTTHDVPAGIPHVEYFERHFDEVGFDTLRDDVTLKEAYYDKLLANMRQYETVEIMTHPAYICKAVMDGSSWNLQRMYVLDGLIHSSFAQRLKADRAFELATYDVLKS
jgi:hypothetical protein